MTWEAAVRAELKQFLTSNHYRRFKDVRPYPVLPVAKEDLDAAVEAIKAATVAVVPTKRVLLGATNHNPIALVNGEPSDKVALITNEYLEGRNDIRNEILEAIGKRGK